MYWFCKVCGLRIDGPGECIGCGGERNDASEYPQPEPKKESGAVAPKKEKRGKALNGE